MVEKILNVLGFQDQEVSIVLVNNRFIQQLNKKYRGIDSPTDVLAFPMHEGEYASIQPQLLGDVVISIETAKIQAEEFGHPLNEELIILLIHGILHLAGYDHEDEKDAKTMRQREKELYKSLVRLAHNENIAIAE